MESGGETCVSPDVHASRMPNIPWRKSTEGWWELKPPSFFCPIFILVPSSSRYSTLRGGFRISYDSMGPVQLTFLRLMSSQAHQNFTYTCINSAAWYDILLSCNIWIYLLILYIWQVRLTDWKLSKRHQAARRQWGWWQHLTSFSNFQQIMVLPQGWVHCGGEQTERDPWRLQNQEGRVKDGLWGQSPFYCHSFIASSSSSTLSSS